MAARPTKIIAWNLETKEFDRLWTDNQYRTDPSIKVKIDKARKEK